VRIVAISEYLPAGRLTSEQAAESTGLAADVRRDKLGIESVHIAQRAESTSDLAAGAVSRLLRHIDAKSIDFLLLVTQNPDYTLPTTACVVQAKCDLPKNLLAFDINQGCSGYVIALAQGHALISSGIARRGLIVTAEIYNRVINPRDKDTYGLFGDGATATLVEAGTGGTSSENFFFGTDGTGAEHLIVEGSGTAPPSKTGNEHFLFMNGRAIFEFVLRTLPAELASFLARRNLEIASIDYWFFHQANRFMNGRLTKTLGIPDDKVFFDIGDIGNTVSSTIPIAMRRARAAGLVKGGRIMLLGFGVGLSWAGCVYELTTDEEGGAWTAVD